MAEGVLVFGAELGHSATAFGEIKIGIVAETALPGGVIDDPVETRAYECDALTAYRCSPLAVALPRTTAEVSEVLSLCHKPPCSPLSPC